MSSKLESDVCCRLQVAPSGKATEVTAGLAESNGSLLPGLWRDSLHVTCGLTACTPGSALGPTLGNEYGKTSPFTFLLLQQLAKIISKQPRPVRMGVWKQKHELHNTDSRLELVVLYTTQLVLSVCSTNVHLTHNN